MPVSNDDEAIKLMNDSPFGLTASLWTDDESRAEAIANQIETGTVFMNRADYLDPGLCWTGCKDTGRGGALSEIGYHNLTRPKASEGSAPNFLDKSISACSLEIAILTYKFKSLA